MGPSSPLVKISEQYAQSIRDTSIGKNGNDSRRVDPTNRNYDITFGDSNMAKELVRHGPNALYVHIMRAAFDPVYGRAMSIAREEEVKPATRFPLIENTRQHERSENNNSPAIVYNIDEHPRFKPQNKQPGEKDKDKPYQPYKSAYGEKYGAGNVLVVYGQRTKKEEAKNSYSERKQQQPEAKKDYKIEFSAANDNKKRKSLYERTTEFIAKTYDAVSKAISYLTAKGYDEKPSQIYSMPAEYSNVVDISQYSAQRKGLDNIVNTRLPTRQNTDISLEERLAA